jgi:Rrf2 family protein
MNTLFNLSEAATIALHSLAIIGNSDEKLNVNKLAKKTKFSKNHLAKILNILVKNRYLTSDRGPTGGFIMNTNYANVTLFEILEIIDGKIETFQCTITCKDCYFESCLFGDHPKLFTVDFVNYLKSKTISDFKLKY